MKKRTDWTRREIIALLERSRKAVMRGLVVIDSLQTPSEQEAQITIQSNGVGWNKVDAGFMSSIAQMMRDKRPVSAPQLRSARFYLMKYAGQLARVANGQIKLREGV